MTKSVANVTQETSAVLSMIRLCEHFYKFPKAGGLLDQDSLFVRVLQNVLVWDSQRAELDNKKG